MTGPRLKRAAGAVAILAVYAPAYALHRIYSIPSMTALGIAGALFALGALFEAASSALEP